jgi:hypothetical protein
MVQSTALHSEADGLVIEVAEGEVVGLSEGTGC